MKKYIIDGVLKLVEFKKNDVLSTFVIPKRVTSIGESVFRGCSNLKSITIPDSVTSIGKKAFVRCSGLTDIIIPDSVTSIGEHAFDGCSSLANITISKSITSIDRFAFCCCSSFTNIIIPQSVTAIDGWAFSGCTGLTNITIPDSVTNIDRNAFYGCRSLVDITIPDSVTNISYGTFSGCTGLTNITIPNSVASIEMEAFKGCAINYISETNDGKTIFSKEPQFGNDIIKMQDISNLNKTFKGFDIGCAFNKERREKLYGLADKINKAKIKLPQEFIAKLIENDQFNNFVENANLSGFKNINKMIEDDIGPENEADFFTFAYNIGCFSNDRALSQKANEWLENKIEKGDLKIGEMHQYFESWVPTGENAEFSGFLFSKNPEKKTTIFDEIKSLNNMGQFLKRVYDEFLDEDSDLKDGGRFRDKDSGRLKFAVFHSSQNEQGEDTSRRKDLMPTVELFQNFFASQKFSGVKNDFDKEIADELSPWIGMEQKHFDCAKKIMGEFSSNKIPANIV
ncbi:MAG: leucine-rich repeat domain-containing protein, partial [Clostridia bacterium]